MKQYCRYCANATQVEEDMCVCDKLIIFMKKQKACRPNKCKMFEFNEIDVFNFGHKYKPRKDKKQTTTLFD